MALGGWGGTFRGLTQMADPSLPPGRHRNLEDGKALEPEVQWWKSTLNPHESLNFPDCAGLEDQIELRCCKVCSASV